MPGPFTITAATNSVQLDSNRQGEATFTVFNGSGRPLRGQARLKAEDPAATGWLSLAGEAERDFDIAAAHQFAVQIQAPPDAPTGSYPFRLDMVGVEDPDEDYSEGPTVTFQVPEPQPEQEPFPWWIVGVVAGVLIVGAIIIFILLNGRDATVTVPRVRGETLTGATTLIENAGLQVAGETREESSDAVAANRVIETDPPAGTEADRGSEVTLIVSSGPVPITPTPTPTPPITVTPTPTEPPEPSEQTWSHDIVVNSRRQIYYLRLTEPGTIKAQAQWSGSQDTLALIINGPGQGGYYAREDGSSPLTVAYEVSRSDLEEGDTWRLSIVSFGNGRAEGTVDLSYPSGSRSVSSLRDSFTVDTTYGSSTNLIVLKEAGPIQAQATWSGATDLALILNGPGQMGYFARQDGSSPLSIDYDVTSAEFDQGDIWRVSLTGFNSPSVSGRVELTYP